MNKTDTYRDNLLEIATTVNKANRFQPEVRWTPGDEPLEYAVVDTATTDDFGDPVCLALTPSLTVAVDTAYRWTLNPVKSGNDWHGLMMIR